MSTFSLVMLTILYFLICGASVVLLVVGLPGIWVIVAASGLYAWVTNGEIPWWTVVIFAIMAGGAEALEFVMGAWGSKKFGSSRGGMIGAIVGGLVGAILLSATPPVIGTLIGAFAGSFLGAFILEYIANKDLRQARRSGTGAIFGKLLAIAVKGGLAVTMIIFAFAMIVLIR